MSDSNAFLVKIKDWFKPIEGAITRPIIGSRNMDIEIDGAWQTDVIDQSESSSSFTVNDLALEFTFAGVTLPDVVDPIDHFTPRVITKIRVKINLVDKNNSLAPIDTYDFTLIPSEVFVDSNDKVGGTVKINFGDDLHDDLGVKLLQAVNGNENYHGTAVGDIYPFDYFIPTQCKIKYIDISDVEKWVLPQSGFLSVAIDGNWDGTRIIFDTVVSLDDNDVWDSQPNWVEVYNKYDNPIGISTTAFTGISNWKAGDSINFTYQLPLSG